MANIRAIDLRLVEDAFSSDRGPGYVLDFSDRTFAEFFASELRININDQKYFQTGASKGKRLKAFLQLESDAIVARALRALWEYRQLTRRQDSNFDNRSEARFFQLVNRMDGRGEAERSQTEPAKRAGSNVSPDAATLAGLSSRLLAMTPMKSQARGFAFETFLSDLFSLYNLAPRRSFRLVGEQIDGSFELPPETFLVEAKWQDLLTGQADLLVFSGKVEGKAQWSRGLFISYSGFSDDGLRAFALGRRTSIICMNGLDLAHVLSGQLSLVDVIQRKKRRAAETGQAFVPVRELFSGVT